MFRFFICLSGIVLLSFGCRPTKPVPKVPEPEIKNPYLGKWENVQFKFFNVYSIENSLPSTRIDSSVFGKFNYTYNFVSNLNLELNFGDTQKVIQPFTIINDNTIAIRDITGKNKDYTVVLVNNQDLILENQEASTVTATVRYATKKREIWKRIP